MPQNEPLYSLTDGETGDYQGISDPGDNEPAEGGMSAAPGPLTHSGGELCVTSAQSSIKSTIQSQ